MLSDADSAVIKNIEKVIRKGLAYNLSNHDGLILEGYCKECCEPLKESYSEVYSRYCYGIQEELSYANSYCKRCAVSLKDKPLIDKGYEAFRTKVYLTETVFKYNGFQTKRYSDGSEIEELSPDEMRELRWPVMKGKNI